MIEFLAPIGWLVALAALLPIGAALLRERWERPVRRILALRTPGPRTRFATGLAATLAIVLLAAAIARPAVRTSDTRTLRTDAQVYFIVDISRSMLARQHGGETRYHRAVAVAAKLRTRLPDVPAGIASLTDRPLPHLFPVESLKLFWAVLHRSLGIQRPPPSVGRNVFGRATTFDPLVELGTAGYFGKRTKHRLVILLTDGESNLYQPDAVATQLREEHVGLLVVRFWNAAERVYRPGGGIEPYRPEVRSLRPLKRLVKGVGGRIFTERDLEQITAAARRQLGHGPTRSVGQPSRLELAPYAALAAVVPLAFLLRRRDP